MGSFILLGPLLLSLLSLACGVSGKEGGKGSETTQKVVRESFPAKAPVVNRDPKQLSKTTTVAFVHIARSGGMAFNKMLHETNGFSRRRADCLISRSEFGNASNLARYDIPNCELISTI